MKRYMLVKLYLSVIVTKCYGLPEKPSADLLNLVPLCIFPYNKFHESLNFFLFEV